MSMSHDDREFVERRINDLDRRREDLLTFKLKAVEELFKLTVETRTQALRLALERLQEDGKGCLLRCANQVKIFNDAISTINDRCSGRYQCIKDFKHDLDDGRALIGHLRRELNEEKKKIADIQSRMVVDDIKSDVAEKEATEDNIKARVTALEKWRDTNFTKSVIFGATVAFAILQGGLWIFTWLIDFLSKTKIGGGS